MITATIVLVAITANSRGVLVAEAPSGAGDVVLGVSLCVLLALSSLLFARTLFSFVSEKTKHNNQRQRRKSYENDGDVDDEKEDDKNSTPLHFSEDSGLYFPKSDSALGAVKNKIMIFLQAKIGRYLMIGQEAWETPYFDFESNLAQPGPGERTQLFELFQKYRGPLKKEEKEEETKNTKTKRNRRQQASHEFEEELLEYSASSLTTNRRSGNRSSSSSRSRDRNHHRHRSSSSRNDIYNHNNSKSHHNSSSPSSPRSNINIVTTTNRKFQDNFLKSQLVYDIAPPVSKSSSAFNNKSPPRSSRQQHDSRHGRRLDDDHPLHQKSSKTAKLLVYDFSLRRRLCTSWFFISLVITAIVAILAGTGRANSDNCFGAFIGAFVLSAVSCMILAWLRPYIIPWMNATSIALSTCNVIGGLAFLYVFLSTQPESENDDSVGQKLMELQGWTRFAQVMCSFPAAILGPIILAVKVLRVGFLMISKSKIVTRSALRSRMIAELDDIEKSMSLGDFAANLAENRRNGGNRNQSSQQQNSSGSKGRRRSSAGQQQSWFFGLFS